MNNEDKLMGAIGISVMFFLFLLLIVVLWTAYKDQQEISNFKIPSEYILVKYDENNFVIMDSAKTKFLVWWDNNTYSMETTMGNLNDSEINMKRHLIAYLKEKAKKEEKLEIQERIKNTK